MNNKAKLLATSYAMLAAMSSKPLIEEYEIKNPYSSLESTTTYSGNLKGYSKTPLTKKQKKARAKSKLGRKQRRNK